jgi:hypothetical protein
MKNKESISNDAERVNKNNVLTARGYKLRGVVSLKHSTPFEPVAIAFLTHRRAPGRVFTSLVYERCGELVYADAILFAGPVK